MGHMATNVGCPPGYRTPPTRRPIAEVMSPEACSVLTPVTVPPAGAIASIVGKWRAKLDAEAAEAPLVSAREKRHKLARGRALDAQKGKQTCASERGSRAKRKGPTRPFMGAYGCFLAKNNDKFRRQCAGMGGKVVMIMAAKVWRQLGENARRPYQLEFSEQKRRSQELQTKQALAKAKRYERVRIRKRMKQSKDQIRDDEVGLVDAAKDAELMDVGGPAKKAARLQAENICPLLAGGVVVSLQGLSGLTELNGQRAVVERFDVSVGRYVVKLDRTSERKRARPENLAKVTSDVTARLVPGVEVMLTGLQSAAALNGRRGRVEGFDQEAERYVVRMTASHQRADLEVDRNRVRREHVMPIIASGTSVVLSGLQGSAELNGSLGVVEDFDESCGRYIVQIGGSSGSKSMAGCQGAPCLDNDGPSQTWVDAKAEVAIYGVQSTPELNGQRARVERFDAAVGRYVVRVPGRSDSRQMSPKNLCSWHALGSEVVICGYKQFLERRASVDRFIALKGIYAVRLKGLDEVKHVPAQYLCAWYEPGKKVVLQGISTMSSQNCCLGKVECFDAKEGRYLVRLNKGSWRKLVRVEHLSPLLPSRSLAIIEGLSGAVELNGRLVTIVRFDETYGRYWVKLSRGEAPKRVKPENLRATDQKEAQAVYEENFKTFSASLKEGNIEQDDDALSVASVDSVDLAAYRDSHNLEQLAMPGSPDVSSSSSESESVGHGAGRRRRNAHVARPVLSRALLKAAVQRTVQSAARQVTEEVMKAEALRRERHAYELPPLA